MSTPKKTGPEDAVGLCDSLSYDLLPSEDAPRVKDIERMSDRELLRYFANLVCTYDRSRDEELRYLEDHPNRDAWDSDWEEEYKGILAEIHAQYVILRRTIDHINTRKTA